MFSMINALKRLQKSFPFNHAFIADNAEPENWSTHVDRVSRLSSGMFHNNIKSGDIFGILAVNSLDQATLIHSGYWSNQIAMPINFRLSDDEIGKILKKSGARHLFVSGEFSHIAKKIVNDGWDGSIFGIGDNCDFSINTNKMIEDFDGVDPLEMTEHDSAILLFTGGTTGEGKGVMLSHRNIVSNGLQVSTSLAVTSNDKFLHVAPMFHSADLLGTAVTLAGGCHSFVGQPSPENIIQAIISNNITMTMTPPVLLRGMIESAKQLSEKIEKLRIFICGGSPVPLSLLTAGKKIFATASMVQGYGLTETSPIISFLNMDEAAKENNEECLESSGKPLAGVDVKIVGKNGIGEVQVKGPNVFKGYFKNSDATKKSFADGWFKTGDIGRFDKRGYLHILDREKDIIITGGENVYSVQVEQVLMEHPKVEEVAVIGLPDDKWGERVVCIIVKSGGVELEVEELIVHCKEKIGSYKIPKAFYFHESLPKTPLGKVLKGKLKDKLINV